jgi:hypothetical protein
MDPGVIGGQRQPHIAFVDIQKVAKLPGSSPDVLERIVDIVHSQGHGGLRHQLHQSDRALVRNDIGSEIGFHLDHSV